jgi:hypothetical protein
MKPEDAPQEAIQSEGSFYRRWSEKKQASRQLPVEQHETIDEEQPPGDEDMPPLESLDENSDYSGFLSPKVSDQLRQLALRKLFHSAAFNVCDGLDDYAEDFTTFEKLGDVMTADLRYRLEQEALKQKDKEEQPAEHHALDSDDAEEEVSDEQAPPLIAQQEEATDEAERDE